MGFSAVSGAEGRSLPGRNLKSLRGKGARGSVSCAVLQCKKFNELAFDTIVCLSRFLSERGQKPYADYLHGDTSQQKLGR